MFRKKVEDGGEREPLYLEIARDINRLNEDTKDDRVLISGRVRERVSASIPYWYRLGRVYTKIEELGDDNPLLKLFRENLRVVEKRLGYGESPNNSRGANRMGRISKCMLNPGYILGGAT